MTWHERVADASAHGHTFLLDLTAIDEVGGGDGDRIRVVARLLDPVGGGIVALDELVDRDAPRLASVADLFPGASWLERQVHDLFGVDFDGGDDRPLIYHGDVAHPLRKDVLLEQRQVTGWPGGLEPGERGASPSRRKLVPPGVPDPEVLSDPDSTAADIALSATGTRIRRRR